MEVVINACYGGFGLSRKAIKRIAEMDGKSCYFFKTNFEGGKSSHSPIEIDEKTFMWSAFSVPDPDKYMDSKEWNEMTMDERAAHNKKWSEIELANRDIERTDPKLIQLIKEIGEEEASGDCAKLRIVEIPNGTDYSIEEYDGFEHVADKHRTWN